MRAVKILRSAIILSLWLGCHLISTDNVTVNIKILSELNERSGWCSWTLSSPEDETTFMVPEEIKSLSSEICLSLGCGDVYKIKTRDEGFNSTCLTGCFYNDTELNCSVTVRNGCKTLSEVACGSVYVVQTKSSCSWALTSPDGESSVYLTADEVHRLSRDICHQTACGEPYDLIPNRVAQNQTCLTNCVYHDSHLKNCTEIRSSDCSLLSELQCGNGVVRLVGGGHRCGGRVEVWRGSWGTVCDDGWDEEDAAVVCAQLGCGYTVSVSGMGEPYGKGTGAIHLDELNCTGTEKNLWDCPAISRDHDCGHKEDASVVCSEYKALRLTGGLDRCSGRVEIHRNGTWGTVCDSCWQKDEAAMGCDMLKCGALKQFTAFDPPFIHKNGTLWFFHCISGDDLWECNEYSNIPHLCKDSKAAGLVCENSLGLPVPIQTQSQPTFTPATTATMEKDDSSGFRLPVSPEQLGCFVLALFLLIAIIINIILCRHKKKKKKEVVVQERFANLQNVPEAEENNYRDSVHLIKVTNNGIESEVPIIPRLWPQSSVESETYDTDYEQNDISPDADFPLSTFRNSMRYSADGKKTAVNSTNLNSVTEEVDSFESSSTSSGEYNRNGSLESTECYENTGLNAAEEDHGPLLTENLMHESEKSCVDHTTNSAIGYQDLDINREDSPIYSPVTYENDAVSCESDYDDIGNYLQPQPEQ